MTEEPPALPNPLRRIVIAPGQAIVTQPSGEGSFTLSVRRARRYDELAAALERRSRVPAFVTDGSAPVPGRGTLVMCRPDVLDELEEAGAGDLRWVAALDLDRGRALLRTEALGLASAVEILDYHDWVTSAARPPAIYGLIQLAPTIGATVDTRPQRRGARHGRMVREQGDLPELLADYLAAYGSLVLANAIR